jgi:hypothetical protein
LSGSSAFLSRHPELRQLFESNAGMQQDMLHNPGNYLAKKAAKHHHRHPRGPATG